MAVDNRMPPIDTVKHLYTPTGRGSELKPHQVWVRIPVQVREGSPIGRGNRFKTDTVQVRVLFHVHVVSSTDRTTVFETVDMGAIPVRRTSICSPTAEAHSLELCQCEFESHQMY